MDGGSGGGTGGADRGHQQDGDGNGRIFRWEDTVANEISGTKPNDLLAYALGLKLHHPIMRMLGGKVGQLELERDMQNILFRISMIFHIPITLVIP